MPTSKPRVQVTLSPETYRAVAGLSKVSGLSMSRICADVIEEAVPLVERAAGMLQAAEQLTDEARAMFKRGLAGSVGRAQG